MHIKWVRPTQAEYETRGILAWLVQVNTNMKDKQGNPDVQPAPYFERNLARRLARGDDMPDFVDVIGSVA